MDHYFSPRWFLYLWCITVTLIPHAGSRSFQVQGAGIVDFEQIFLKLQNSREEIVAFRRDIHAHPELLFEEYRTSQKVREKLTEFGISYFDGLGAPRYEGKTEASLDYIPFPDGGQEASKSRGTGIIADIGTGQPPCIALRADMDALPVKEAVDVEYKSIYDGKMHACGHDAHTAMLLYAAKYLKSIEAELMGTIRLIFQPGEEGGAGGLMMEREGVLLKYPAVSRVFGLHVHPGFHTGVLATRRGYTHATVDSWRVDIDGLGGHAALPAASINPLPPAMAIVSSLNSLAATEKSLRPREAGLITATSIRAGQKTNVIPDSAIVEGTIRTFSMQKADFLREQLLEISHSIAAGFRCKATVTTSDYRYKVLENDPSLYDEISEALSRQNVRLESIEPAFGGEDFSFFAAEVPGFFAYVGTGNGTTDKNGNHLTTKMGLHNPKFALDEDVLPYGAAYHEIWYKKTGNHSAIGFQVEGKNLNILPYAHRVAA